MPSSDPQRPSIAGVRTSRPRASRRRKSTSPATANSPAAPACPQLDFYFAYNAFRLAGILQGIVGRVRDGTASQRCGGPERTAALAPLAHCSPYACAQGGPGIGKGADPPRPTGLLAKCRSAWLSGTKSWGSSCARPFSFAAGHSRRRPARHTRPLPAGTTPPPIIEARASTPSSAPRKSGWLDEEDGGRAQPCRLAPRQGQRRRHARPLQGLGVGCEDRAVQGPLPDPAEGARSNSSTPAASPPRSTETPAPRRRHLRRAPKPSFPPTSPSRAMATSPRRWST